MTTDNADQLTILAGNDDNSSGRGGNPFRPAKAAPAKAVEEPGDADADYDEQDEDESVEDEKPKPKKVTKAEEKPEPAKSTAASLDEITDLAVLRKLVRDGRREAAQARTKNKDELAEYEAWKEAQKTEAQRAIDKATKRAEAAETRARELVAANLVLEYNVSDDLAEFITGSSEDEMRARAEKLRDTRVKVSADEEDEDEKPAPKKKSSSLHGGRRTPQKTQSTEDWFGNFVKGGGRR